MDTRSWHSIGYGEVDEDGNEISASVLGTAVTWNKFDTDYGYIKLGPANAGWSHIYTNKSRFIFNAAIYSTKGIYATTSTTDIQFKTGPSTRLFLKASTGNVGIGTSTPQGRLDIVSTGGALIVPRMTTTQRGALSTINGSIIYNTSTDQFNFFESGSWVTK